MKKILIILITLLYTSALVSESALNILVVTVDDMNCDSIGVFGSEVKDTTPHLDKFSKEAMRFNHAHVHASSCIPSRNIVQTGRYLWNSGVEGFYAVPKSDVTYQTTPEFLRDHGYFTMIRGKAHHSSPYSPYPAWDIRFDDELKSEKVNIRKTNSFYDYTLKGIKAAKKANKPFYYSIDIHDPHTPFYNWEKKALKPGLNKEDIDNPPSKIFKANEIVIPKFLPKTPLVKQEMAAYYSTVRRADDSFGYIIKALKDSGVYDNTLIIFFSDHGMPLPFAKTALYYHSTHTPLMVRWPNKTQASYVDSQHVIGTVDIFPTLAEIIGVPAPKGLDGRSFASILKGQKQTNRDYAYTMYEENVGGNRQPMRSIVTKDFGYIFSPWSDGTRKFATATKGTATYKEMVRLSKAGDKKQTERLNLFTYSEPELLFNYAKDPDALNNLIKQPEYKTVLSSLKETLKNKMLSSGDPLLKAFKQQGHQKAIQSYLAKLDQASKLRKKDPSFKRNSAKKVKK